MIRTTHTTVKQQQPIQKKVRQPQAIQEKRAQQKLMQQQLTQQQNVIPPLVIDWLQQFGFRITGMNGTTVIYFDEDSRRVLRSEMGADVIRRLSDMMDAYLVMTDERIIAVGHRFKPCYKHSYRSCKSN